MTKMKIEITIFKNQILQSLSPSNAAIPLIRIDVFHKKYHDLSEFHMFVGRPKGPTKKRGSMEPQEV